MCELKSDISIVVPNYNNALYLQECIQSIEKQTYPIHEIIVVDDCSTDNSRDILLELQEQNTNLRLFFLKENRGVSNARNEGLALVKTPYVSFIDADDFYVNDYKIENEMKLIDRYKDSFKKNIIAYSITVQCSHEGEPNYPKIHKQSFYLKGNIHFQLLQMWKWKSIMRDYCVCADSIREVGGYDVKRNLFEDWELLIKLSRKSLFFCTMEYGPGYRNSEGGLSRRTAAVYKQTMNDIFETEIANYIYLYKIITRIIRNLWNLIKHIKHRIIH